MFHMKTSSPFFAVAAAAGVPWSISNVPVTGLTDIAFLLSIANAPPPFPPPKKGYYFARQFSFKGSANATSDGETFFHTRAIFSNFIKGSTTVDRNCHEGADGGAGVGYGMEFLAPSADYYVLEIRNTQRTMWNGTVVDALTPSRYHIGSYTLPAGTEGIAGTQVSFVEYFLPSDCPELPYASVEFGTPVTSNRGSVGWLEDPYESGDCVGKIDFKWKRTPRGIEMSFGFKVVETWISAT
ncbi:hypothetical protein BS47DRAFT_1373519 [Hydnum rufescens UP504]|uniref:Uncharacterized protein n=1 Tax=Hydnum rufescens UP504 TaxID=1448309 RepID=A0A9P6APS7_9AGAM|nr:hypothetical protein BS47DRAFT_1373519 [Hydnum rufescens UP504]